MEEFDEDDFSDLYADVEVQASSAISAMHRSTELPPRIGSIVANAARGAEIDGRHRKYEEHHAACGVVEEEKGSGGGDGFRNLPVENRDRCGSWSESEDGLNSDGDDGNERKTDENRDDEKYDDRDTDVEMGEIAGKEKSVNGGNYGSQRKILQYNSLNSTKKRVDEMTQEMRRTCKKGNTDDRDPFFSRACADNQPNYGWKHGELKIASERHTQACLVPLDLDKRGSVQISDSVEDSPHEVSECESEGISETSHHTNRRQVSRIYNKVSSTIEPESSERGRSQHGRGYSCSPIRAALSSRYFGNSSKRSRYSPSSLHCELQEPIPHENRTSKDSESRCVKRGTGDGRYRERWRDSTREHSNQFKKSNYTPYVKNRPDEDSSYAIDAKHLYNRHANRGKPRELVTFNYNENDIPYCSQSERILTYSGGRLPDHRLGPPFLKDQYGDIPNCRYKAGRSDGHNMSGRQHLLDNKSSQMDYEALEHNRYHNQRRHPFQGDIAGLRSLAPKYSSAVNRRGTQFMYKGDSVHHRRRTIPDCLSPLHEYDDKFLEGKYRRVFPNNDRDRDYLDRSCDQNVARARKEVESSGRDKRRHHSFLNSSENLGYAYIESHVNDRRNIKHRPFPFYSSDEPYVSGRGELIGAPGKNYGVAQRNIRCSWKEMRFEFDQYGTDVARESVRHHPCDDYHIRRRHYQQSPNTSVMRDCIKDDQYQDHFLGRRRHRHSEVLLSREDVFKPRQQDNVVFGFEEPSYHFKRTSKNEEADDRLAFCHVTELNERELVKQNSNMLREEDNSEHFDGCRKSTQHHSHAQIHPSQQDSVDRLVVVGRKCTLQSSIRRTTEAGEDTFYGRHDLMEWGVKEMSSFEDLDASNPEKTAPTYEGKVDASLSDRNQQSKLSKNQQNEFLDIEEGQIITEEMQKATKCINAKVHPKTASDGNGIADRLDDEKIREIMMKMERRRERFKEPITTSRDCEKTSCPLPESNVDTAEARLERPARKRRWLGT